MNTGLKGKVVWITGASGGIGRALAKEFASEGCNLILQAGENLNSLETWVSDEGLKDSTCCVAGDVRNPESLANVVRKGVDAFRRIDVCIANAGIWPLQDLPIHKLSSERIRSVLDINLLGVLFTAREFFRHLDSIEDPDGTSLCFVGSTAGKFGERGHAEYAASKAALVGILRTLKNEIVQLDPFGRVNLVEPGWTATSMAQEAINNDETVRRALTTMPLRQIARPEDIARSVLFVSAPLLARHITGQTLTVAGGMEGRSQWEREDIILENVRSRLEKDA